MLGILTTQKLFFRMFLIHISENKSIDEIKEEIKYVYSAYIRYYIWKNNWDDFFNEKHDLDAVKDWSIQMGSDRFRW